MKLLFVSELARFSRSVYTITKYVEAGKALGHEVAVFGERLADVPAVPCSLDVKAFDFAVFVIHDGSDFPDLPYLAQLLDGMPKERRVIIDCCGRHNDTIRVEHDFNHLEKMDGHQGWEWIEAFQAVSKKILQPTITPLRSDVGTFLFHGYDPAETVPLYRSPKEAAHAWAGGNGRTKPYGFIYVGNNWQRWTQVESFLKAIEPVRLGRGCIAGWDWNRRPDWAIQLGIRGADVDPDLMARLGVETRDGVPFNEVTQFLGQARFSPVLHRPLFNHLGLVTNRTFQTFCADTIPVLMIPDHLIQAIYGSEALLLAGGDDLAEHLRDVMRRPEDYWQAVWNTREHLARYHSYRQRFRELEAILTT